MIGWRGYRVSRWGALSGYSGLTWLCWVRPSPCYVDGPCTLDTSGQGRTSQHATDLGAGESDGSARRGCHP